MEHTENIAISQQRKKRATLGVFTPKDVSESLWAAFLDDERCRQWILACLHGCDTLCPACGKDVGEKLQQSFWAMKRIKCAGCGAMFTALTGTFLSGAHMKCKEIVLLCMLLSLGVADKEIGRIVRISAESVRLWRHKFQAIEKMKAENIG